MWCGTRWYKKLFVLTKNLTGDMPPEKLTEVKGRGTGTVAVRITFNRKGAVSAEVVAIMKKIARIAVEALPLAVAAEVSVVLCDDRAIHRLNSKWRGVDAPTDVLAFPQMTEDDWQNPAIRQVLLGDIVLSLESANRQAKKYGHSTEREILYLFTHGLLHLLGHDHLEEDERYLMRRREEEIMAAAAAPSR
jgi:probable rRNA maturation factor